MVTDLTRLIVVIILRYIQISNRCTPETNIVLCVSYTAIKNITKQTNTFSLENKRQNSRCEIFRIMKDIDPIMWISRFRILQEAGGREEK